MTAQIIQFPARGEALAAEPLPAIDAWIDEVDEIGPDPTSLQAHYLLARCPDPAHPVAAWLAGLFPAPSATASNA